MSHASGPEGTQNPLVTALERIGDEVRTFTDLARKHYHSWKDHPQYLAAIQESHDRLKEHVAAFDPVIGLRLLETVLETRVLFDALLASYKAGEFKGALLRGYGQEAVGAGVGVATEPHDVVARDHRSVSAAIARGTPVYDFWANHLMRATGPTGGYDPNIHFADLARNDFGFQASDMALSAVLVNGGTWYLNAKRAHEKGVLLLPRERSCGVAIIGDGAASNGLAHEGMNFAKTWDLPVLFVILNNQIALRTSPREEHGDIALGNRGVGYEMPMLTVDGDNVFEVYLAARMLLDFARETNHPVLLHAVTFRRAGHNDTERQDYVEELFGKDFLAAWGTERSPNREKDPLAQVRRHCEALGFADETAYRALLADVRKRVEDAHQEALRAPEPSPAELRTALMDPDCSMVRALAITHPAQAAGEKKTISFKEALQSAFREEFANDPLLIMLGEDIGWPGGGVFEVTTPLVREAQYRDRIRNAPLGEAAISGFVTGVGLMGGRAIGEYQFWNFFLSGPSPILTLAATRPFAQKVGIAGVLRGPCGYAPQSNHYHETWPETYLLKALGIKVVVPATPEDAKGLMKSAVRDPDLVAVLEEMSFYGMSGEVPEGEYFTPFEAIVRRAGKDITLVTWGPKMLMLAREAAQLLSKEGIDLEVIDLRILNPWDKQTVFDSLKKTSRIIVLHEDSAFVGFGAEIAATIAEDPVFYELSARIRRIASRNTPIPVHLALENARLPSVAAVVAAARELIAES